MKLSFGVGAGRVTQHETLETWPGSGDFFPHCGLTDWFMIGRNYTCGLGRKRRNYLERNMVAWKFEGRSLPLLAWPTQRKWKLDCAVNLRALLSCKETCKMFE
jgi:hypothetical protein